jgi:hypothetical protein
MVSITTTIGYGFAIPVNDDVHTRLLDFAHREIANFDSPQPPEPMFEWLHQLTPAFSDLEIDQNVDHYFGSPNYIHALAIPSILTISDDVSPLMIPFDLRTEESEEWVRAFSQLSKLGMILGLPASNGQTSSADPDTYGWLVRNDIG